MWGAPKLLIGKIICVVGRQTASTKDMMASLSLVSTSQYKLSEHRDEPSIKISDWCIGPSRKLSRIQMWEALNGNEIIILVDVFIARNIRKAGSR